MNTDLLALAIVVFLLDGLALVLYYDYRHQASRQKRKHKTTLPHH